MFIVVNDSGYQIGDAARHPLNGIAYRINYVLDDFEGLAQKYVALAISKGGRMITDEKAPARRRRRRSKLWHTATTARSCTSMASENR